jgi:hypothetical protein
MHWSDVWIRQWDVPHIQTISRILAGEEIPRSDPEIAEILDFWKLLEDHGIKPSKDLLQSEESAKSLSDLDEKRVKHLQKATVVAELELKTSDRAESGL